MKNILVCGNGIIGNGLIESSNFYSLDNSSHRSLRYAHSLNVIEKVYLLESIASTAPQIFVNSAGPANVNDSFKLQSLYLEDPLNQCKSHLEILVKLPIPPTYIFISSGSVYGDSLFGINPEDAKTNPLSPYAQGKLLAENYLQEASQFYPAPIITLRVYSAYSNQLVSRIPYLIASALLSNQKIRLFGDGKELRDFIHVSDIGRLIDHLANINLSPSYEVFNVGTGTGISISALCEIGMKVLHSASPNVGNLFTFSQEIRIGDPRVMVADIRRIQSLGFSPNFSPEYGMEEYFKWQLKNILK